MAKIKASYLMPNYNKQAYLAEALESLLCSTEKNIEIVVVDDGSTDYSMDLLEFYKKRDSRVRVFTSDKNNGIGVALNRCTAEAQGEILLPCAGDDVYDPNRAKWAIKAFKKFKEADIIYWPFLNAQERLIKGSGVTLVPFAKKEAIPFDAEMLKKVDGQFVGHGFSAYKAKVGKEVKYREEFKHGIDHHFFLDAWKAGFKFQNIDGLKELAGIYRFHQNMVSQKFRDDIYSQDCKLEAEYKDVTLAKTEEVNADKKA